MALNKTTSKRSWVWALLMAMGLAVAIIDGTAVANMAVMRGFSGWTLLANIAVVAAVITASATLDKAFVPLRWSWWRLFSLKESNVNLTPMKIPYFGILFFILAIINLPYIAMIEEKVFRAGTDSWREAVVRSFVFGLAHCIVGVSINTGIALSLAGLWFSFNYFRGGVDLSALHHATYNLILFSMIGVMIVIDHVERWREQPNCGG